MLRFASRSTVSTSQRFVHRLRSHTSRSSPASVPRPHLIAARSLSASATALSLALWYDRSGGGFVSLEAEQLPPPHEAAAAAPATTAVAGETFVHRTHDLPGACGCTAMRLVGTGIRYKWGLVKCYAVALYITEKEILATPRSSVAAAKHTELLARVISEPFDKALHLKFVRQLSAQVVADALADAFAPRLDAENAASQAALAKFRGAVMSDTATGEMRAAMPSGTNFTLVLRGGNRCVVAVDGVVVADIRDRNLVRAIADTYCGAAPVTHGDFARGAARLLRC